MAKQNLYCPLPWKSVCVQSYGVTLCCTSIDDLRSHPGESPAAVFSGEKMQRVRQSLLSGEWPKECRQCEQAEKIGELSMRQISLRWFADRPGFQWHPGLTAEPGTIGYLELAFDKTCNLKCRMCSPKYSSKWKEDVAGLRAKGMAGFGSLVEYDIPISNLDMDGLIDLLDPTPRLMLKGGEPMLNKRIGEFLRRMVERKKAPKTIISINTNGTVVSPWFMELAPHFKEVHVLASVDGSGPLYHYIRNGSYTTDDVKKSLKMYPQANPKTYVSLTTAFQIYNMLSYDKIVREFQSLVMNFNVTMVFNDGLCVRIAPDPLREEAIRRIEKLCLEKGHTPNSLRTFSGILGTLKQGRYDAEAWRRFWRYTRTLDKVRRESIDQIEPELCRYEGWMAAQPERPGPEKFQEIP